MLEDLSGLGCDEVPSKPYDIGRGHNGSIRGDAAVRQPYLNTRKKSYIIRVL